MATNELEERYKQDILDRAEFIVEQGLDLNIIYLRVSTKTKDSKKAQHEEDQNKPVLKEFNLDPENCIIIRAKESAFKLSTQKNRRLNIVIEIAKKYKYYGSNLFIFHLDRLYRNQRLQTEFMRIMNNNHKCIVWSASDSHLVRLRQQGGYNLAVYNFIIETMSVTAEKESKDKGNRLLKSLTKKNGRFYSNKNNLVGRKIEDLKGNPLKLSAEYLDKIDKAVIRLSKKGLTYDEIKHKIAKYNIKLSNCKIHSIKVKYGLSKPTKKKDDDYYYNNIIDNYIL
jgi:DNA invertase Pin-like site-specific DNA recombinase